MSQPAVPANLNIRVFTQSGSFSEVAARNREVCFTPQSGLRADIASCPFRARKRLMHRSKLHLHSTTSSAMASGSGGKLTEIE
jgi:hypothetical protein